LRGSSHRALSERAAQALLGFHFQPGNNLPRQHSLPVCLAARAANHLTKYSCYVAKKGPAVSQAAGPFTIFGVFCFDL